jgi:hypothetical protein
MVASRKSPERRPPFNIPLEKAGEIIEHVGAERKRKAVDVRITSTSRQNCDDRNCSFENDRDDEHCEEGYEGKIISGNFGVCTNICQQETTASLRT